MKNHLSRKLVKIQKSGNGAIFHAKYGQKARGLAFIRSQ